MILIRVTHTIDVTVMDEFVLDCFTRYYEVLARYGYFNYKDVKRLITLCFLLECTDKTSPLFRLIKKRERRYITRALHSLFGTSYVIPYPDFDPCGGYLSPYSNLDACDYRDDEEETVDDSILVVKVLGSTQNLNPEDVLVVKVLDSYPSPEAEDNLVVKVK